MKRLNPIHRLTLLLFLSIMSGGKTALAGDITIPIKTLKRSEARMFVIGIGVGNYQDPFWPTLKWPADDARKFVNTIGNHTQLNVIRTLLVNEQAQLSELRRQLEKISATVERDDTVILYISSHGTLAADHRGDLQPIIVLNSTQQTALQKTGLTHSELSRWMSNLKARKSALILASCHSGEGKSHLPNYVRSLLLTKKGDLISLPEASEGTLVLAAAAQGESAYEDDQLKGDIYTHYFLEALTTYDRNQDGVVSTLEAHDYARNRTWYHTAGRQRPTLNARFIGDADIPLYGHQKSKGLPVLQAYDERLKSFQIKVDLASKGDLPSAFPLNPDGSTVSLYHREIEEVIARYRVTAKPGEQLTLEEMMNHRPFSVTLGNRYLFWKDSSWERATQETLSSQGYARFGFHRKNWGLNIYLPNETQYSNHLRDALKVDMNYSTLSTSLEYQYPLSRSYLFVELILSYENAELTFTDAITQQQITFKESSIPLGISVGFNYRIWRDLYIGGHLGLLNTEWEFDTVGTLIGDRTWFALELSYRFGGKARTL